MKSWADIPVRCLVLVLWAAVAIGADPQAGEDLPIEDVELPIELYDDGTVKTRIRAARAKIPAAGDVIATQVKIEFYTPDGSDEEPTRPASLRACLHGSTVR